VESGPTGKHRREAPPAERLTSGTRVLAVAAIGLAVGLLLAGVALAIVLTR
jgi:tetrahydromethanopterin S-methyltransferase subunit F